MKKRKLQRMRKTIRTQERIILTQSDALQAFARKYETTKVACHESEGLGGKDTGLTRDPKVRKQLQTAFLMELSGLMRKYGIHDAVEIRSEFAYQFLTN